jgi:hypothetical protein
LQKIKGGKYQSKGARVGVIVLNKKQGITKKTTSRCSREVLERGKQIIASNKE